MKFGICLNPDKAHLAKECGFDYVEVPMNRLSTLSEAEWESAKRSLLDLSLPIETANLILPKDIRAYGSKEDERVYNEYLGPAFRRMGELGVSIVVFGSGKSRNIPEGWSYERAFRALSESIERAVDTASSYGIEIVVEPLNRNETDIVNSLFMGRILSSISGASLLADSYHMFAENENMDDIVSFAPIRHAHIAMRAGRTYPTELDEDIRGFIGALRRSGYDERISIEGKSDDIPSDGKRALGVLRGAWING